MMLPDAARSVTMRTSGAWRQANHPQKDPSAAYVPIKTSPSRHVSNDGRGYIRLRIAGPTLAPPQYELYSQLGFPCQGCVALTSLPCRGWSMSWRVGAALLPGVWSHSSGRASCLSLTREKSNTDKTWRSGVHCQAEALSRADNVCPARPETWTRQHARDR